MLGAIVRFIVSALVIMLLGFLLPGVRVESFTAAFLTAVVIAALGWLAETLLSDKISPRSRGWVGFITAAVVIYIAGTIVPGFEVGVWGALLTSFVVGLIDTVVPTEIR